MKPRPPATPYNRYQSQTYSCRNRVDAAGQPIEMRLTFEEWWAIWQESGCWEKRGRKKGEFCMSRFNDLGHYEVGNVFIQLVDANHRPGRNMGLLRHLSDAQVREIRAAITPAQGKHLTPPGGTTIGELSLKYGVSKSCIRHIRAGLTYKDVVELGSCTH